MYQYRNQRYCLEASVAGNFVAAFAPEEPATTSLAADLDGLPPEVCLLASLKPPLPSEGAEELRRAMGLVWRKSRTAASISSELAATGSSVPRKRRGTPLVVQCDLCIAAREPGVAKRRRATEPAKASVGSS